MPTTLTLHSQDIALLIAGIVSLVAYAAIWVSVATAATARQQPAWVKAGVARIRARARRRAYTGRHWATA